MDKIPDFDKRELQIVQSAVNERYGKEIELQLADSETKITPTAEDLTWCPTVFWSERGSNFVILKIGAKQYRSMFYYQPNQQYGTGRDSNDDLEECVLILLRLQADHEKDAAGAISGKTGKNLN